MIKITLVHDQRIWDRMSHALVKAFDSPQVSTATRSDMAIAPRAQLLKYADDVNSLSKQLYF